MGRLNQGVNDLETLFPLIAKEFDIQKNNMLPSQISAQSHKKVWWLCSKGHSFEKRVQDKVLTIGKCPCCDLEETNLEKLYPDIAKEFDIQKNNMLPMQIKAKSNKKVWWLCPKGHSYDMILNSRTTHNQNCPICSGQRIVIENSLATLRPELVNEWDYEKNTILPTQIAPYTNSKKVWWKCDRCGNSWQTTPKDKVGCPFCKWKPKTSNNSLVINYPDVVKIWDYNKNNKSPDEYMIKSNEKVWFICKNGHSFSKKIYDYVRSDKCPKCIGKEAIQGETDLATVRPDLIKEWDFEKNIIKPTDILPYSKKKVWWKCERGHSWETRVAERTQGHNCPVCCFIPKQEENIETLYPELLKEWDFNKNVINPNEIMIGSSKKVWWKCNQGHSYQCTIYNRLHNCSCIYCSNKTSQTELHIQDYLTKHNISFIREYIFDDLRNRRFDFFLPDYNLIIEVDGLQHFKDGLFDNISLKNVIKGDNQKNTFLLNKQIPILRIIGKDTLKYLRVRYDKEETVFNQMDEIITNFIKNKGYIDQETIQTYLEISKTNYGIVAEENNKLVEERRNQCQIQN